MRKLFFRCFSKSPAYAKKAEDDPDTQQRLLGQLYGVMDVNPQSPRAKQSKKTILAQVLHFVSLELFPPSGLRGWEPLWLTCLSAGEPRGFFPAVLEPTGTIAPTIGPPPAPALPNVQQIQRLQTTSVVTMTLTARRSKSQTECAGEPWPGGATRNTVGHTAQKCRPRTCTTLLLDS